MIKGFHGKLIDMKSYPSLIFQGGDGEGLWADGDVFHRKLPHVAANHGRRSQHEDRIQRTAQNLGLANRLQVSSSSAVVVYINALESLSARPLYPSRTN